jgi:SAM-dependent methyltransferase
MSELIGKAKKVLDLGCGTCLLQKFLHKSCEYMGWDLNDKFLKINPKLNLQKRDIFDFENYPKVDTIVISDVLHHIFPRHIELIEKAKSKAKQLIVMEPHSFVKTTSNTIANLAYHFFDRFFGDNDGINDFHDRLEWFKMKKEGVYNLLKSFNPTKLFEVGPDYLVVFENNN